MEEHNGDSCSNWRVIGNTIIFMVGSTLVGTALGILFAVLLTRTNVPGRTWFAKLITIPYYVSALILAFAWRVMYGPQGFITVAVGQLGLPTWNLYSMGGLIVVAALYFMPLTYLYCSSSLLLADPQLENAARISGARPMRVLLSITIPLIRPAMLYSVLLTLVSGIELLSIPLVLGVPSNIDVLSTFLYRTAIQSGSSDYGMLAVVALMVVVFVTILVRMQNELTKQERRFVSVGGKASRARTLSLGELRWPAAILVGLLVVLTIVVPLVGITLQAFTPFLSPLANPFSLLTLDNFREGFLWALLSVPAIGGLRNTLWVLVIAYSMRYLPLGFSSVSPSILQISDELDRAARVSGADWLGVMRHIMLPLLRPALIATYLLIFITFLKEYSVALFLNAPGSEVIGTTMIQVSEQGGMGPVAALAVVQLLIIAIVLWISGLIPTAKVRE